MALTELQLPTKIQFYARLQSAASEMRRVMYEWQGLAQFIGRMDASDYTEIGIPSGGILQDDITSFKVVLNEALNFFDGVTVTPVEAPNEVIMRIRNI